jgi:hypothetical protein
MILHGSRLLIPSNRAISWEVGSEKCIDSESSRS